MKIKPCELKMHVVMKNVHINLFINSFIIINNKN